MVKNECFPLEFKSDAPMRRERLSLTRVERYVCVCVRDDDDDDDEDEDAREEFELILTRVSSSSRVSSDERPRVVLSIRIIVKHRSRAGKIETDDEVKR